MAIETPDEAREALLTIDSIKSTLRHQQEQLDGVQAELIDWLDSRDQKTLSIDLPDGRNIKGTAIHGTRVIIDEPRLKKTLGAKLFNKLTKRVLDKNKLEDAMASGEVNPLDVATCSDEKHNRPYMKVTVK